MSTSGDTTCLRMDYSGSPMWFARANIPSGTASVHRLTMDGLTDEDFSGKFAGQHPRLTVLPDQTVAFAAFGANGCDDIKELSPSGSVRTVVNAAVEALPCASSPSSRPRPSSRGFSSPCTCPPTHRSFRPPRVRPLGRQGDRRPGFWTGLEGFFDSQRPLRIAHA